MNLSDVVFNLSVTFFLSKRLYQLLVSQLRNDILNQLGIGAIPTNGAKEDFETLNKLNHCQI